MDVALWSREDTPMAEERRRTVTFRRVWSKDLPKWERRGWRESHRRVSPTAALMGEGYVDVWIVKGFTDSP